MKQLNNGEDFHWHKAELDVGIKRNWQHYGEPKQYPCIVTSELIYCDNGPDYWDHDFEYLVTTSCECCGHSKDVFLSQLATEQQNGSS